MIHSEKTADLQGPPQLTYSGPRTGRVCTGLAVGSGRGDKTNRVKFSDCFCKRPAGRTSAGIDEFGPGTRPGGTSRPPLGALHGQPLWQPRLFARGGGAPAGPGWTDKQKGPRPPYRVFLKILEPRSTGGSLPGPCRTKSYALGMVTRAEACAVARFCKRARRRCPGRQLKPKKTPSCCGGTTAPEFSKGGGEIFRAKNPPDLPNQGASCTRTVWVDSAPGGGRNFHPGFGGCGR